MPPSSPGTRPGARPALLGSTPKTTRSPQPARSGPLEARGGEGALKSLLADLGSQIRRGRGLAREVAEPLAFCPTGIPRLDARLGGGFPRGRLTELCGAPSSGRTSLATALLAETLARGALAAWIDPADAFDPASAAACLAARGGLWTKSGTRAGAVRCGACSGFGRATEKEAIRCCERILATEGFELTLFDLAHTPLRPKPRPEATRRERPPQSRTPAGCGSPASRPATAAPSSSSRTHPSRQPRRARARDAPRARALQRPASPARRPRNDGRPAPPPHAADRPGGSALARCRHRSRSDPLDTPCRPRPPPRLTSPPRGGAGESGVSARFRTCRCTPPCARSPSSRGGPSSSRPGRGPGPRSCPPPARPCGAGSSSDKA